MVIETAFVLPILLLLALGGYDVSRMVTRHAELQSAVAEAAAATLAKRPDSASERTALKQIIQASSGLAAGQVTLSLRYRCGVANSFSSSSSGCGSTQIVSEYLVITMTDKYVPHWTAFGIGGPVDFSITRRVQIA